MKIITGSTGEPHITPSQDAMWHRAITGSSSGIFDEGEKFATSKVDNTSIKVLDGVLSIQGRFVIIEPRQYDIVQIENGSQGVKRIDLVCARIFIEYIDDAPAQSADIYVFKGDEAVEDPVPPTIPERDLDNGDVEAFYPFARVELEGINIKSVVNIGEIFRIGGIIDSELSEESTNPVENRAIAIGIQHIIDTLTDMLRPV